MLFNSTDEMFLKNTIIPAHELHFTQIFEQYLQFQSNGDQEVAAVRLGIAIEVANNLQELWIFGFICI